MSFSDFVNIVQVVAMIAALAAVWYAEQAVVETRALRREERMARLLDLIADLGESGTRTARGQAGELLDLARLRLKAALRGTGEPLRRCECLLALDWPSYAVDKDATEREARALAAVAAALDEVAELLMQLRAEGSDATDYGS